MSYRKDLTGQRFGRLIVKEFAYKAKDRHNHWLCICDCGIMKTIQDSNLYNNLTTSCGCLRKEVSIKHGLNFLIDLTGQQFGELTVLNRAINKGIRICWNCICSGKKEVVVLGWNLTSGHTSSCGHINYVSKSEKAFLDKLEKLIDEKIERQLCIQTERGRRFYDGFIKSSNTLIEVDGSRWHTNIVAKENDKFKELKAKQFGYNIQRFSCNSLQDVDSTLKTIDINIIKRK